MSGRASLDSSQAASFLEKNLILFLDPGLARKEDEWSFVRVDALWSQRAWRGAALPSGTVFSFSRRSCLVYLALLLRNMAISRRRVTRVLYFNHGVISIFCRSRRLAGYRMLARENVSEAPTWRRRLLNFLPVFLRAELRFATFDHGEWGGEVLAGGPLEGNEVMIFSNVAGKLLLVPESAIRAGSGYVVKTSSNRDYLPVLEREHAALKRVRALLGRDGQVPAAGERLEANGRVFFSEAYVGGPSLKDVLFAMAAKDSQARVSDVLDDLERWYQVMSSTYSGAPQPLSDLYAPVLETFNKVHGQQDWAPRLIEAMRSSLRRLDRRHPGLAPVLTHNDLWPGNFIVSARGLVAIDWERATFGRCAVFEYFWMLISTAVVYYNDRDRLNHSGLAARKFLLLDEELSRDVAARLRAYLKGQGFDAGTLDLFLLLFLIEWSVQGYLVLGSKTYLDDYVVEELRHRLGATGEWPGIHEGGPVPAHSLHAA